MAEAKEAESATEEIEEGAAICVSKDPATEDEDIPAFMKRWHNSSSKGKQPVNRLITAEEYTAAKAKKDAGESMTDEEKAFSKAVPKKKKYVVKGYWEVETHSITFLGGPIANGVASEFIPILKDAQKRIYDAFLKSGGKADDKNAFIKWCNNGVVSDSSWLKVSGWRNQNNKETSFHNKGVAIDIQSLHNPYIVIRSRSNTIGFIGKVKANDKSWRAKKARGAVDAYDHAVQFKYSESEKASTYTRNAGDETIAEAYDRLKRVHNAVVLYFSMLYDKDSDNKAQVNKHTKRGVFSKETFIQKVLNSWKAGTCRGLINRKFSVDYVDAPTSDDGIIWPDSTEGKVSKDWTEIDFADWVNDGNQDKVKQDYLDKLIFRDPESDIHPCLFYLANELYPRISEDYEALRRTWNFKAFAENVTVRDPCWGFLNIRKEIVVNLFKAMASAGGQSKPALLAWPNSCKARWGGSDFGTHTSGDMMHFDLYTTSVAYSRPTSGDDSAGDAES